LVSRLRAKVATLQGEWEALGAMLETERCRLGAAEAALAALRQEEASLDGGASGSQENSAAGAQGAKANTEAMAEGPLQAQASEGELCARLTSRVTFCPAQVAAGRCSPTPEDEQTSPSLNLAVALPLNVWQAHLTSWVTLVEAARLRGACKALRGLMDECPVELGEVRGDKLKAALTCFPAAQSLNMVLDVQSPDREGELVDLLRDQGGTLKRVIPLGHGAERLVYSAVRAGALPKLTCFNLRVSDPEHRQWLSNGRLRLMEEVGVALGSALDAAEEHLAAFEHLRQLPRVQSIALSSEGLSPLASLPAFIPSSLKTLALGIAPVSWPESLLRDLPSMLQVSGASLERLIFELPVGGSAADGTALARVLHTCSPTLKTVQISLGNPSRGVLDPAFASEVASGLVSCSNRLEFLRVPWKIFKSLPPTCPTFKRLTGLSIKGGAQPVDFTSAVWERVASGLLPKLTALGVDVQAARWGHAGGEGESGGECRLMRCLGGCGGHARDSSARAVQGPRVTFQRGLLRAWLSDRQDAATQVSGLIPL
jgi:hypothetical protein